MTSTFGHIAIPDGVVIDQNAPMSMMAQPRTRAFQPDAGVLDIAKSAFHETWMSSVIDWYNRESFAPDPTFVPNAEVDDLIKNEPRLARHRTWLNSTQSKNELSYVIEQARKADVHAQIAEDNPAMFFALSLAVGIPDPLNLVGLGPVARSRSLAEAMATGARAGLLQGSIQGVLSYAADPRFSMSDVMASASFGSMIGAGAGTALHFSSARRGRTALDDHLDNPLSRPSIHPDEIPGTSARARSEAAPGPSSEGSSQAPDRIRPGFYSPEHFVPGGETNRSEIKPGLYSADQFTPGFADRAGTGGAEPSAPWRLVSTAAAKAAEEGDGNWSVGLGFVPGKPIIVYRGVNDTWGRGSDSPGVNRIRSAGINPSLGGSADGMHFAATREQASFYGKGGVIQTFEVTLSNPLVINGRKGLDAFFSDPSVAPLVDKYLRARASGTIPAQGRVLEEMIDAYAKRHGIDGVVVNTNGKKTWQSKNPLVGELGARLMDGGDQIFAFSKKDPKRPGSTAGAGSGAFKPTADWQVVPPGTVLPAGMEIRIDLESGSILARKLPDDGAGNTAGSAGAQTDGAASGGGVRQGIEPGFYPADEFIPDQRKGPEGSVGAMQNPNRPAHVPGEAETGTGIEKLKVGPIQRAIASRFAMMNDIATRLFSSPVSKLNQLGVGNAISAEVGSWRWQSNLANLSSAIDSLFLEYRGASQGMLSMSKLLVMDSIKGAPAGLMSRNEFKKRVWQSYVFDEVHQEPQVNAASAKILEFYKAFSEERLALGMTKVEVPYFEFHLRNGIMRERPFPRVWNEHVLTTPDGRAEFKKAWNDYKALLHPSHEHFKTSWEWALDTLTLERPFVSADGEITGVSSSMYSRNLKVPTKLFEKFVVTDPEQIAKMYAKSMGVDIEIARRFRVLGPDGSDLGPDSLLRNAVGELYAEAGSLVNDILVKGNKVWPTGGIDLMHQFLRQLDAIGEQSRNAAQLLAKNGTADPASLARIRANAVLAEQMLEQQFSALFLRISPEARDIFNDVRTAHRDVSDLRALLRGTYGQAADPFSVTSRSIRVAKQLSSLILLSGAVAALPDIGNLALREGLRETMAPLLSWFRSSDPERAAIMKNAAFIKEAGQALDMVLNSRALAMTDMSDIHGRYSTFERILDNAQAAGFVLNLLSPWTAAMKQYSGVVVQSNLFRRLNEWSAGTLSDPERAQLLARGITEQLRDDILDQMRTHGRQHGDIFLPNAHDWDVQATREAYAGILADLVNRIVVSPSPAEMPLLFSKEHGSLIFQFKSFGLGTVNRVLVPALQEADGRLVTGVAMLVAMGSIVDELKWAASGNTRERSDEEKLYRAIERSGVLGWFVDAGKAIDTVTDGRFGWGAMTGAPHREQNFVQKWTDLMGPSASLVTSATELGHHLLTEGPDANAAKRLASLTPLLGRVTHFSWATNAMTNHENWKRQTYGNDASSLPQELPWMLPQGPANANATKP